MKRILFSLLLFLTLCLCGCQQKNVPSTNLSQIMVDDFTVGFSFSEVETENYTVSNRYKESEGVYNFEECRIETTNGIVTKITANVSDVQIIISRQEKLSSYDDILSLLGENNSTSWYDREQNLKQIQYFDYENHITCSFVYNNYNRELIWIILEGQIS